MVRFEKSPAEFEGRYYEVNVLVEEEEKRPQWDKQSELAVVGKPSPRADGAKRISGASRYTVDIVLPGMLYTAVLRSPIAHGRVRSIDVAAARRAPGVRVVMGPTDVIGGGDTGTPGDEGRVLSSEPRFVGDAIAAVAAETPTQANEALAYFALDLEPLPHYVDFAAALLDQRFTQEPDEEVRGDPAKALRDADVSIEVEIETAAQIHTALEPHAAVAHWTAEDELTVWLSTQAMFAAQAELAGIFGLPTRNVRIISEFIGGGFGAKVSAGPEGLLAAELARRSGRPVRLANSRHEEQILSGHRPATRQSVRIGASRDGTLVGIESDVACGMGIGGMVMPYRAVPMTLYQSPNASAIVAPVRLNLHPCAAFRAPGVMEATTAVEQAMDELAIALEMDPLELRRRAHADTDQRSGNPYSSKALLACYDRAAELSGWSGRDALRDNRSDGLLRGMGCATQLWYGGGGPNANATVRLDGSGVATVVTGIQDIGTGSLTAARMVAAEELGFPVERVRALGGDTAPSVYGPTSGGSTTIGSVMPAVRAAAAKVRRQLLELASEEFEIAAEDLVIREGRIQSVDRTIDRAYTEITDMLEDGRIDGWGMRRPNPSGQAIQTFGCQIAQVTVDAGTGVVAVEKIWAVHDIGRVINPLTASSQVEGGIIQGLGYAVTEARVVDPTLGGPTNATMDDYKVPTIADVPEIVVEFIDHADPATDVGAKGLGEPPIVPTPAAIANAFAHATGRRSPALPLTPYRVLEVLG